MITQARLAVSERNATRSSFVALLECKELDLNLSLNWKVTNPHWGKRKRPHVEPWSEYNWKARELVQSGTSTPTHVRLEEGGMCRCLRGLHVKHA